MASSVRLPSNPIYKSPFGHHLTSIRLDVRRFNGLFLNLQSLMHQWYICSIQYLICYLRRCTTSQSIDCRRQFQRHSDTITQSNDIINIDSRLRSTLHHNRDYSRWYYSIYNHGKCSGYCCCDSREKSSFSCLLSFRIISCRRFNGSFNGKSVIAFLAVKEGK